MAASEENFAKLAKYLSENAPRNYRVPITYDTTIWKDLRIYGDDLFELAVWLHETFGVEPTSGDFIFCYAPKEQSFFRLRAFVRRLLGFERQYQPLTVRDILDVIDARRWPVPESL
jgi:hypothetical protein